MWRIKSRNIDLQSGSEVSLGLYDITDRKVQIVFKCYLAPGVHNITLSGAELPSGTYFLKLDVIDNIVAIQKSDLLITFNNCSFTQNLRRQTPVNPESQSSEVPAAKPPCYNNKSVYSILFAHYLQYAVSRAAFSSIILNFPY